MPVNIVNVTVINGITDGLLPSVATAVVLLPNPTATNVFKVDQIMVANVTSSAATATVQYYSNASVAKGSAPSGGTAYPIASTISVPASASLIVVDKTTAIYLQEGTSISVTSGTANGITYSISYEDMS